MRSWKVSAATRFFRAIEASILAGLVLLITGCPMTNPDQAASNTSGPPQPLATWTNSFTVNGTPVPFTMVGTDPSIPGAGTTTIPVLIIPVTFAFGNVSVSPSQVSCGDSISVLSRVQNSPLFTNNTYTDGAVNIGNTQFIDAYQRKNFWSIVSSASPNYHVLLQASVGTPLTVNVPPAAGAAIPNPFCPQSPVGEVSVDFATAALNSEIAQRNLSPHTLVFFLSYDILYVPQGGAGVLLGLHSMAGNVTYILGTYTDQGFSPVPGAFNSDIQILTHEFAEWADDPLLGNQVPAWGNIGQQQGCTPHLEVGDPLTGNAEAIPSGGFTYHVQELAYFSWFVRNVPSLAVNGSYSTGGSFTTPAPVCF